VQKIIICFLCFFLFSVNISISGSISGITGTITQGQTVTISAAGSTGFGSGDSSPIAFDDFESYTDGNSLSSTPLIGTWELLGDSTTVEDTTSHSGSLATYHSGDSDYANFEVALAGQTYTHYYISYWFYYNYTGASSVVKVIQLHGNNSDCDYWPGVMWSTGPGASGYVVYAPCSNTNFSNIYTSNPQNQWNHIELVLRQSTASTSDGHIEIKINGNIVHNSDSINTRNSGYWTIFEYFYSVSNSDTSTIMLDDIYANNSWSRVVMGTSENYADNDNFEICPVNSWSDGSIQARVNVGDKSDTAYLWVVDSSNIPSDQDGDTAGYQGYEIVIGSSQQSNHSLGAKPMLP